ncbi:extracellular mutant 11 domain-containing [Pyrenophora seminiperda CCB06]|uniref:Extracellular mutant 11 domain-containing n=1 Tax=Pyrenophora seminiperda CCB06 TaxID=1302712 RepID=A0A3M7MGR1_9PLEO|nr:extracellular mutant 11 domain-containing [Pyrenophora seminiperda CCB06]
MASGLSNFVSNRNQTASPHNGQPKVKIDRAAAAAAAKVPMRHGAPLHQPQAQSAFPARGLGHAQNSSAVLQPPQRQQTDQGHAQKHDPYDTDAASLDTTIDTSAVKVENNQNEQQADQPRGQVVDVEEGEDEDEEEAETGDEDEGSDEQEYEYSEDDRALAPEEEDYVQSQGLGHLSHEDKLQFLRQLQSQAQTMGYLPTVQGDSYPPTTDGEPSEWEVGQGVPANFHDDVGPASPSPQRPNINNQTTRMVAPQPRQQQQYSNVAGPPHGSTKPLHIFQSGAQLREQSRSTPPVAQHGGHGYQPHAGVPSSSQLPTHQPNTNFPPELPMHLNPRPNTHAQASRPQQSAVRQSSSLSRVQFQSSNTKSADPPAPIKRQPSVRPRMEPVIQQQSTEQVPVEEIQTASVGDYDYNVLTKMKYEDLKNENFDTDPRAGPSVLTEEENQKELSARLRYVQRNLNVGQQSEFFSSLSSTEWEDAGDWFLDQFQSIIQRTRQARQQKRKLAQEFEREIEKRHEHVSKKQHQVQQAMDKMKAQGEGLVPRSPRTSRSPRPKRN